MKFLRFIILLVIMMNCISFVFYVNGGRLLPAALHLFTAIVWCVILAKE